MAYQMSVKSLSMILSYSILKLNIMKIINFMKIIIFVNILIFNESNNFHEIHDNYNFSEIYNFLENINFHFFYIKANFNVLFSSIHYLILLYMIANLKKVHFEFI